jgi:cytochrome c oxidase subunit 2
VNSLNAGLAVVYALLGGVLVIVIGVVVAWSTLGRRRALDTREAAEHERTWFVVVVVLLAALLFATIFFTPYGKSQESAPQEVNVQARQFAFLLDRSRIRAGEKVKFHLTSADVNHGFAVFDSHNKFLFQVQVMPKKTQDYVYTFKRPGTYRIVCFEYCGSGHDQMEGQLTVRVSR